MAWSLVLSIEGGEIIGVTSPLGEGTPISVDERRKYKKSKYGLRLVDTLTEHDTKDESFEEGTRHCFMVIGGFKVEVPCPTL